MADRISMGLEVVRTLTSERNSLDHDEVSGAIAALQCMLDVVTADTAYHRRFRDRVSALIDVLHEWRGGSEGIPTDVVDAARACLVPVPV